MNKVTYNNLTTEQQENLKEAFEKIKFKINFGIDAENEEEARQKLETGIYAKLEAGKKLSAKEMQYLQQHNPVLYMQAVRVEQKRNALKNQLENAKSKEEVQKISSSALASVRENDPAKRYVVAAIQETVKKYKESGAYKKLPETEEQVEKNGIKAKRKKDITYEVGEQSYQVAYAAKDISEVEFHVIV